MTHALNTRSNFTMSVEPQTRGFRRGHRTYRFTPGDEVGAHFTPTADDREIRDVISGAGFDGNPPDTGEGEKGVWLLRPAKTLDNLGNALDDLLNDPLCEWAGPLVLGPLANGLSEAYGSSLSYLTHEMIVTIRPPADVEQVLQDAESLGYDVLRVIPYAPVKTLHLRAAKHPGYELLDHCEELMRVEGVVAEPNLAGSAVPMVDEPVHPRPSVTVTLADSPPWDREKIAAADAWEELRNAGKRPEDLDVVLAVVDGSFEAGVEAKDHFRDYQWFDLRCFNNSFDGGGDPCDLFPDGHALGHGLRAAGVAAASAAEGAPAGVAPGCHVLAVVYPATEVDVLDMYAWLAGIDPGSPRPEFPAMLSRPAAIVTTSLGFGFARQIPAGFLAHHTFEKVARDGRGGQGTLLFFAAGNDDAVASRERPWATESSNFAIAASTSEKPDEKAPKDPDEATEILRRAAFSNHHGIELCAPGPVYSDESSHSLAYWPTRCTGAFGGTSAAAPLAAGVAALVLAARPDLRHDSVRQILCETARKIDLDATDSITLWRNADREPAKSEGDKIYSYAYGFGQIDAAAAVREALTFVQDDREDGAGDGSALSLDAIVQQLGGESLSPGGTSRQPRDFLLLAIDHLLQYLLGGRRGNSPAKDDDGDEEMELEDPGDRKGSN